MKKLVALAVLTLITTLALAQTAPPQRTPPSPEEMVQHHVAFLTKFLSLTTAQQATATTLFTNAATAEATVREGMKTAHQSLQAAVKTNDAGAIDTAASSIGTLTAQSTAIQAKSHAAFLQILTPEQQAKFGEMHMRMPGPGGPHGPGFGGPGIMMRRPGGPPQL